MNDQPVMACIAPCYSCSRLFAFDVDLVPSLPVRGVRQPICRTCIERANRARPANGLPVIVIARNAYFDEQTSYDRRFDEIMDDNDD